MFRTSFHDGPSLPQRRRRAPLDTSARFRPQVEALEDRTVANTSGDVQGGQGQLFLVLTGLNRKARVRAAGGAFQRAVGGRVAINLNLDQLAAGQQLNLILEFRGVVPRQLKRVAASVVVGPL